ncbi:hypothetical protein [Winogradskyella sp.]|uniref:hypothetical protein n=1 Tax=Winogradskyella sp. TaxID=1883156 RepID=UPI0038696FF3
MPAKAGIFLIKTQFVFHFGVIFYSYLPGFRNLAGSQKVRLSLRAFSKKAKELKHAVQLRSNHDFLFN